MVRRLSFHYKLDPFEMWEKRSPRQVLELVASFKAINDEIEDNPETKDYKVKGKVKVPSWYKVPKGATVIHADDVTRRDLGM